ncbi:MAG TPA: HAD hydrolase-like protein [Anaeromyxobacteraceae bacterium]|nr:HAD hydrolase-like protein [Anaeromyxobacteraceae bacterium]
MIRLALFDLDGTLVDSREDLYLAVRHALSALGLPARSPEDVISYVGEGAARLLERAIDPQQHLLEPALAAWRSHYGQHLLDHTRLYPGIGPALASARCALAVHTNKPGAMARRILEGLGVLSRFGAVVGGDEAPRKPDPTGTLEIMVRLDASPGEAVFVGDSRVDQETAAAAGVRFVAVSWGFSPASPLAAGTAAVARDAADLLPWLSGGDPPGAG